MTAKKTGRPSKYSDETAESICAGIAQGKSLREICSADGFPDKATVCRWLAVHPAFRDQYAQAREAQAEHMADEILDIADDGTNDWMERKDEDDPDKTIGWRENGEAMQRSRLRVDTRKWLLSKLLPKKYGEKLTQELTGKDGAPLVPILNVTISKG